MHSLFFDPALRPRIRGVAGACAFFRSAGFRSAIPFRNSSGGRRVLQAVVPPLLPPIFPDLMNKQRVIPLIVATALFMEVGVIR